MDTIILILDQHQMDPSVAIGDRDSYHVRTAVRAVLRDGDDQIALMYSNRRDYYKLPGGGVDDEESLQAALHRELLEEVGAAATINSELGHVIEWRDYSEFKQISYAYVATLNGDLATPDLTESEIAEGFEVRWVSGLEIAIDLVEANSLSNDVVISFMSKRDAAILRAVTLNT